MAYLAQDSDLWLVLVNVAMNFRVAQKVRSFLTSSTSPEGLCAVEIVRYISLSFRQCIIATC